MTPYRPIKPIRLYSYRLSGHCHRVEMFLGMLGLPYEIVEVNLRGGEQKTPEFRKLNRFCEVPVIEDDGIVLPDSNAILVYLAKKYGSGNWLPDEPLGAAKVQRWLSVAAGPIASGPASARRVALFGAKLDAAAMIERSHALFKTVEEELAESEFLAGSAATLADIACYSYIALAPEGKVSLDEYPRIRAWLGKIESLPGFLPPPRTA